MICPKCGERIPDDSVFCQECGYKLESDRKKRCEICGTYNDWDAMFCERCGQPLEDEEPETAEKGNRIQGKTIVLCGIFIAVIIGGIAGLMLWDHMQQGKKEENVKAEETVDSTPKGQEDKPEEEQTKPQEQSKPVAEEKIEEKTDYIIPESASKLLAVADIQNLSVKELNYARNEIYARRGRRFKSQELQNYFDAKSWYHGIYDPEEFDEMYSDSMLNEYEKKNADFLRDQELEKDPEGYQLDE